MMLEIDDSKIIIAYSSTAHMTAVLLIIMFGTLNGLKGGVSIIFYHGIISPSLFWVVGIFIRLKSRSLIVLKLMFVSSIFSFILFILITSNIGFPPLTGFYAEILTTKSVLPSFLFTSLTSLFVLLRCYYNPYLFWSLKFGMISKINSSVRVIDTLSSRSALVSINFY